MSRHIPRFRANPTTSESPISIDKVRIERVDPPLHASRQIPWRVNVHYRLGNDPFVHVATRSVVGTYADALEARRSLERDLALAAQSPEGR